MTLLVSCTPLEPQVLQKVLSSRTKISSPQVHSRYIGLTIVTGVNQELGKSANPGGIDEKDFVLCFLPLAHILEFVYELSAILWGCTIGYATVKTLTDASTRNCKGDIKEFRPTILVAYVFIRSV